MDNPQYEGGMPLPTATEKRNTVVRKALHHLQNEIGEGNKQRGFHDEGDWLRHRVDGGAPRDDANLRNYYITKLALVMSEGAEAIEELRNGHAVDETYYSGGVGYGTDDDLIETEAIDANGDRRKPEGVPSEIADIVIRCFDFADEAGFSLGEIIFEKLAYNATRGRMHGGKKV